MKVLLQDEKYNLEVLPVGMLGTNCYILIHEDTKEAIVVDPGAEGEKIVSMLREMQAKVVYILNTHGHWDHIGANAIVKDAVLAPLLIHQEDEIMLSQPAPYGETHGGRPDKYLNQDDILPFGTLFIKVLHTPGHTKGGVSFLVDKLLFAGDTLFEGSIGRTDLGGGSYEVLMDSIKNKLMFLPEDTIVLPGHGPATTIGIEKANNPFLRD